MTVSVVMPVYNAAKNLGDTLSSVERQTYKNWELIAVDDCSGDSSLKLLNEFEQKYPGKVVVMKSSQPRSGASVCRNIGVKNAKGELVIFLDADDLLEPFCLEQRVNVMENKKELQWAVFNQYAWFSSQNPPYGYYNKQVTSKDEAIKHFLKMDSAWQTMAVVWRRQILEELNGFDENLYFMEDPDLHLRALLNEDLNVDFNTGLPADCFYRMPELTEANAQSFYGNSINSRFLFLKKMIQLLPLKARPELLKSFHKYLREGFIDFVKVMLARRLTDFRQQFNSIIDLMRKEEILKATDMAKMRLLSAVFTSQSPLVRVFRLRGLVYRLL